MNGIERIQGITPDLTKENVDKLLALFPDVATEITNPQTGATERAVDFDALKERLGDVAEGNRERYQFTWPGKREAKRLTREPIAKTLRPVKERSKNWDTTKNLYIEGDNLDALKLLRENYAGRIKLIYIDPPYNTGHDFIYKDDFGKTIIADRAESGDYDSEGGQLVANPESNGRFHSDWCSMIYPRLQLARDLLTTDGLLFISIDDNEIKNMLTLCDSIFGNSNKISCVTVCSNPRGRQSDRFMATVHEYLLIYAKNSGSAKIKGVPLNESQISEYRYDDSYGKYRLLGLRQRGVASLREDRPEMFFPIYVNPINLEISLEEKEGWEKVLPKKSDGREGRWMWGRSRCINEKNRLVAKLISRRNEFDIFVKDYLNKDGNVRTRKDKTIWDEKFINNQNGTQEVTKLFGKEVMSFPKSSAYIKKICWMGCNSADYILDFFSGSATTAQAIMQLNAEDGGTRKFIMVQLPEKTNQASAASQAGYADICEIGEDRIRRAGEKIKSEIEAENAQLTLDGTPKKVPDIGFRVLRVDDSNYEDKRKNVGTYSQDGLDFDVDITKSDRSDLDLLFEALPKFQLQYDAKIGTLSGGEFDGHTVYNVNDGQLLACFEPDIPESLIRALAAFRPRPSYVLVSERSLPDSATCTNFVEIFKQSADSVSGGTQIRII